MVNIGISFKEKVLWVLFFKAFLVVLCRFAVVGVVTTCVGRLFCHSEQSEESYTRDINAG